ncbi:MAG: arginine--tRNA ligase [Parcubacteria group bacterium]|nr:arginine--tRNA ligase [Parcubacteria group bacterium]
MDFTISTLKAITRTLVQEALGLEENEVQVAYPPDIKFGDFAVPCFNLAERVRGDKREAANMATLLASTLQEEGTSIYEWVRAVGPYLNIKLKPAILFGCAVSEILRDRERFGEKHRTAKKVMVEYLSPNTNKPLHLGHIRNGVLGAALANLLEAAGHTVITSNLVNDRGVHICKSMVAYEWFGGGQTPALSGVKGDHFVGDYYIRFEQALEAEWQKRIQGSPELLALVEKAKGVDSTASESAKEKLAQQREVFFEESQAGQSAQAMLRKWEAGHPETRALWSKMNSWVYEGFSESYRRLNFLFDAFLYESEIYRLGKRIVLEGLKTGIFQRGEKGEISASISPELLSRFKSRQFRKKETKGEHTPRRATLLRHDGTSVYLTQDLGVAVLKFQEYLLDRSIYVVGSEQEDHFARLFALLQMLGYAWAEQCEHFSYGMVLLPQGKMKSREGKVVDADDLLDEVEFLATEKIKERGESLTEEEIRSRAKTIGLGAIKFFFVKSDPRTEIRYDPAESLDVEGFTGPYCQYAYTRCRGILRRAQAEQRERPDFSRLGEESELWLIRHLIQLPEVMGYAAETLDPSQVAQHVWKTAQAFNQFYHNLSVLEAGDPGLVAARLALVEATSLIIQRGLRLLGIDTLEKM